MQRKARMTDKAHSQVLLLRTIRKGMPRPGQTLPDRKRAAVRKRIKSVPPSITDPDLDTV